MRALFFRQLARESLWSPNVLKSGGIPPIFQRAFSKTTCPGSNPTRPANHCRVCAPFPVRKKKRGRLPRVSAGPTCLCIGRFKIFGSEPRFLRASLWSRIFNIRISMAETRFEVTETEFDTDLTPTSPVIYDPDVEKESPAVRVLTPRRLSAALRMPLVRNKERASCAWASPDGGYGDTAAHRLKLGAALPQALSRRSNLSN